MCVVHDGYCCVFSYAETISPFSEFTVTHWGTMALSFGTAVFIAKE